MDSTAGREQIQEIVASHRCDVLFPAISPPMVPVNARVIGWIADFQHRHYPNFFSADELRFRDHLFSFLSATCDRIACSSNDVAADFERFCHADNSKTFVLRFTAQPPGDVFAASGASVLDRFGIKSPYVYLPYQFWIHKNHRMVFESWKRLRDSGHRYCLVCTGASNDSRFPRYFEELTKYLEANGLTEMVKILGLVDRNDQWQLYRNAKLILQPSLFEGWSTSVEESRSLGKPVLLSDIPVHREQADAWGHFFDPQDSEALARQLIELWPQLPDGLDLDAETKAISANAARVESFGRALVQLFTAVANSSEPKIAEQVLPLYLHMQNEAQARLDVIESLVAERKTLKGQVERLGGGRGQGLLASLKSTFRSRRA
jgi:glycosyltransferase involved in cell wall biosynthesis